MPRSSLLNFITMNEKTCVVHAFYFFVNFHFWMSFLFIFLLDVAPTFIHPPLMSYLHTLYDMITSHPYRWYVEILISSSKLLNLPKINK